MLLAEASTNCRATQPAKPFIRVALCLAGCVLLVAAMFKLSGRNVSAFAQYGLWLSLPVQIAAVGWELFLGATLLLGACRLTTWMLAMGTFTLFAGVSGYLGMIGQARCGCFGEIQASPWVAFFIDVGMLLLLAVCRPRFSEGEIRKACLTASKWALGFGFVLGCIMALGALLFGSVEGALAKLRGDALTVDRAYIDFGRGRGGDIRTETVTVTNWAAEPIRIVGGSSDCSCIATRDLPITLASGEAKSIAIEFRIPNTTQSGMTNRTVVLFTDSPKQFRLVLSLSASVD